MRQLFISILSSKDQVHGLNRSAQTRWQLLVSENSIVYAFFLLIFLFTLAENFSASHDSISYLNGIIKGEHLFHPHHLLYHFSAHCWWQVTQRLLPHVKDYYLIEAFTALWGSGCMLILYSFFRHRFRLPAVLSLLNTSVAAFSYGLWYYSTNIEVYTPFIFFLLWTLYFLTKEDFQKADLWKIIILHSMAILFYQASVLFTLVVLYKLWGQRKTLSLRYSVSHYALTGILLVGVAYFALGWVVEGENSVERWLKWIFGYAIAGDYWKVPGFSTLVDAGIGFSHAFIGGHFVFNLPLVREYMVQAIASHALNDEAFLVRNLPVYGAMVLTFLTFVLGFLMIAMVVAFLRRFKLILQKWQHVVSPILVSLIVYSLFFSVWQPEILEMWIYQTILVWLLLLGTVSVVARSLRLTPMTLILSLSILMFAINFFGSIKWLRSIDNDLYYAQSQPMIRVAQPNDVVLLQDGWIMKDFMKYYTRATVHDALEADTARGFVSSSISRRLTSGGSLYIFPEASVTNTINHLYIDSLLRHYEGRARIFQQEDPLIIVVK